MVEGRRKRVLLIEDEEALAKLLKGYLLSKKLDVQTESRGDQALIFAERHRPDLVILDIRLPDMNGYEVCKRLRLLYHSLAVPILILSAMDKPIDQLRGFGFGADAYLTKPFNLQELDETIAFLLGESMQSFIPPK